MTDLTVLLPEQQETLVALKQLFTAVEAEVNKTTITPQVFHDILIQLEQTHEHFHKFEFVKILQRKIDNALSTIIESELNKRSNSDPLEVIPEVMEAIFSSAEFHELQESFCQNMQEVIEVMVEIYHDPLRWEIGTPYVKNKLNQSYDDLSSSSNQTGCLFFTSEQYRQIARNLDPGKPMEVRKGAINCLFKIAPGECEHWPEIRQGLMDALGDEDYDFAEEALTLHAKLFSSGTAQSTGELALSLTGHLIQHFQSTATYHSMVTAGIDTAQRNTRCILRRFMLLSMFQHDIPSFWIRCPARFMTMPIQQTIQLLSLPGITGDAMRPIHYLSLYDHRALWFRKWTHGCFTRKIVMTSIKDNLDFLRNSLETVVKELVVPDALPDNLYSSYTYNPNQIRFLEFVHSINLISYIVQFKVGRNLINVTQKSDKGASVVLNRIITIMTKSSDVFTSLDASLNPVNFIPDLLREIIASGEQCRQILVEENNLKALLRPLQADSHYSTSVVLAVCDILAILCSYSVGSSQLIATKIIYKDVPMSGASFIGELCKEKLLSTSTHNSKTRVSIKEKKVLASILFVARQLYTTHDGLALIQRYNLVSLVARTLSSAESDGDKTPQPPSPQDEPDDPCLDEILIENMLGLISRNRFCQHSEGFNVALPRKHVDSLHRITLPEELEETTGNTFNIGLKSMNLKTCGGRYGDNLEFDYDIL